MRKHLALLLPITAVSIVSAAGVVSTQKADAALPEYHKVPAGKNQRWTSGQYNVYGKGFRPATLRKAQHERLLLRFREAKTRSKIRTNHFSRCGVRMSRRNKMRKDESQGGKRA
jgi:hypothetical protein